MNKSYFPAAFLLGAIAILWMGVSFASSHVSAFIVYFLIASAYTFGFYELYQFRLANDSLTKALKPFAGKSSLDGEDFKLESWLTQLHHTLQNPVRVRIEGERVALPSPIITPYFVGLLVMLGLLGTFLGMVFTLHGAVAALEGSTDFQVIRSALAAPMNGLGLAFGTSIAGVAGSAMLGLTSALSRRDRLLITRDLDRAISTIFREFSASHNRQETFKALQAQADVLPLVAEKLTVLAEQMATMSKDISAGLTRNQDDFNESVKSSYESLADSVSAALKDSLAESSRLTGESIKPVVKELMTEVGSEAQKTHELLASKVEKQLNTLTNSFSETSKAVSTAWQSGLQAHASANESLVKNLTDELKNLNSNFENTASNMIDKLELSSVQVVEKIEANDQARLANWSDSLEGIQNNAAGELTKAASVFSEEVKKIADQQLETFGAASSDFSAMSTKLYEDLQKINEENISAQQKGVDALQVVVQELGESAKQASTDTLQELTSLLGASEELIKSRMATEEQWLAQHGERMETLSETLKSELSALRDDEAQRSEAAIQRIEKLEEVAAKHLSELGKSLEEPMTRLIETASETPRAAAEVIGKLREEVSNSIERDNTFLEERQRITEELDSLTRSLADSTAAQQDAIDTMINASANALNDVGVQFSSQVDDEIHKISETADTFVGSAVEISALSEAFNTAVELFNESNTALISSLKDIENSFEKATERSDEQLGYYVAQAREIIDHSIMSQKEIFEEVRQISVSQEIAQESVQEIAQEAVQETAQDDAEEKAEDELVEEVS